MLSRFKDSFPRKLIDESFSCRELINPRKLFIV